MPGFYRGWIDSFPCIDKSDDGFIDQKNHPGFMSGFIYNELFCALRRASGRFQIASNGALPPTPAAACFSALRASADLYREVPRES